MMRERVQCLIIRGKKILLVKDKEADHFYPPGGGVEKGESHEAAIKRELQEELDVELVKSTFHSIYQEKNVVRKFLQKENNYIVEIRGQPSPCSEIEEIRWLSWKEIHEVPLPPDLLRGLLAPLRKQGTL